MLKTRDCLKKKYQPVTEAIPQDTAAAAAAIASPRALTMRIPLY